MNCDLSSSNDTIHMDSIILLFCFSALKFHELKITFSGEGHSFFPPFFFTIKSDRSAVQSLYNYHMY
ncbi:hypothetical protein CW304_27500 [Bacillus sp. UFRGS-B20]|nr:hypothetical protein CW304_27500 [Bacillus sp. UFRGS-B20]